MKAEHIFELLTVRLGLRKARLSSQGWINASCPFETRHGGGKDESPSFGVHVASDRSSKYNCKSGACGMNGDGLTSLIFSMVAHQVRTPVSLESTFWWVLERDNTLKEASARPDPEARKSPRKKAPPGEYDWKAAIGASTSLLPGIPTDGKADVLVPFQLTRQVEVPSSSLDRYRTLSAAALVYLQGTKRKLTKETIASWELGSSEDRISIPMRDHEQRLVGISRRAIDQTIKPKYLHTTGFKRDFLLFGEHKKSSNRTARIVEGHFDVIWLWQCGYANSLAIMGSHPSRDQIEKIVLWFSDAVVFGDGDAAGSKMARSTVEALKARIPVRLAEPVEGKDPNEHTEEELLDRLGPPDRHRDNTDPL